MQMELTCWFQVSLESFESQINSSSALGSGNSVLGSAEKCLYVEFPFFVVVFVLWSGNFLGLVLLCKKKSCGNFYEIYKTCFYVWKT